MPKLMAVRNIVISRHHHAPNGQLFDISLKLFFEISPKPWPLTDCGYAVGRPLIHIFHYVRGDHCLSPL